MAWPLPIRKNGRAWRLVGSLQQGSPDPAKGGALGNRSLNGGSGSGNEGNNSPRCTRDGGARRVRGGSRGAGRRRYGRDGARPPGVGTGVDAAVGGDIDRSRQRGTPLCSLTCWP